MRSVICSILVFLLSGLISCSDLVLDDLSRLNPSTSAKIIGTKEDLESIAVGDESIGKTYYLHNDLDLGGAEITPIGSLENPFKGTFEGNGCTIRNFSVKGGEYQGFFGQLGHDYDYENIAVVKNLNIEGADIETAGSYAAILAGRACNSVISNCSVKGTVKAATEGTKNAGGLTGECRQSTVTGCSVEGEVMGPLKVGGIFGVLFSSTVSQSSFKGKVKSSVEMIPPKIGGFAGASYDTNIFQCHVEAEVVSVSSVSMGTISAGIFIGQGRITSSEKTSTVSDCYAMGTVTVNPAGNNQVGGFIGYNNNYIISRCYVSGEVFGNGSLGGFCGYNVAAEYSSCYWDTSAYSGSIPDGYGNNDFTGDITPLTATEMRDRDKFSGWDFIDTWTTDPDGLINDGYPCLLGMVP